MKRSMKFFAIGWRLILFETFNFLFDYPLYGWTMASLGLVRGWFVMTLASFFLCAWFFWRYDRTGVDWLFANAAREWEKETTENSSRFRKIVVKISESRDKRFAGALTFILASTYIDPVVVAVHYRKNHFKGISLYDWWILIISVTIANLWWGIQIGLLVEILKWLVKFF